jgi:glycosyltransferase involved in cell wall biosynthesis
MSDGAETKPLISVLVPAYNVADYIADCLDSILNQTYNNIEIVIVNDGSTDSTLDICRSYEKKDQRVKVFSQINQGLAETRNVLIRYATGDYVTFVDSDDNVAQNYVESLFLWMVDAQADISICARYLSYSDRNVVSNQSGFSNKILGPVEAVRALNSWKSFDMSAWAKMYRKVLFDGITYPKGKLSEDAYVTYRLLYKSARTIYHAVPLYYYRQREGSISRSGRINPDYIDAADGQVNFFSQFDTSLRPVTESAALLGRMAIFNTSAASNSRLTQSDRILLLKGNCLRCPWLFRNPDIPVMKKLQTLIFTCSPSLYSFLFRLFKR